MNNRVKKMKENKESASMIQAIGMLKSIVQENDKEGNYDDIGEVFKIDDQRVKNLGGFLRAHLKDEFYKRIEVGQKEERGESFIQRHRMGSQMVLLDHAA